MAEGFDPYHIWLGIPPEDQPPHHYRLLGVKPFETNSDALESAADQRMVHVRSFQTGKHAAESQRLLNELTAARLCLLTAEKRAAYDRELRLRLAAEKPPAAPPPAVTARPLAKARPLKAPAAQGTSPLGFDPLEQATPRRGSKKRAASTSPAIYAVIGVGLLAAAAVAWVAISGMGTSEQALAERNPAALKNSASPESHRDDEPALSRPATNSRLKNPRLVDTGELAEPATDPMATITPAVDLAQTDDSVDEDADDSVMPAAPPEADTTLAADQRPELPSGGVPARRLPSDRGGVIADKLVVWNCNNDRIGDRGMTGCNVELRKDDKVVWAKKTIPLAWSQDEEPATTIPLPKIPFDALRVETASYQGAGSAICEVEIFRGETNIARGKTVRTSGDNNINVPAANVVDGVRDSSRRSIGYWAAPDHFLGWVEVQVAPPATLEKQPAIVGSASKPKKSGSVVADRLVVWNCNNVRIGDRGITDCNVALRNADKVVWAKKGIPLAWSKDAEPATTIPLPKIAFDALRIETVSFQGTGAAICEIEIFRGETNIARGQTVTASGTHPNSDAPPPAAVTDGVRDSSKVAVGYWVGPDGQHAWIEVQIAAPAALEKPPSEKPAAEGESKPSKVGGGVTADKLILWNCHWNHWKDRGLRSCNVELRKAGKAVWSQPDIELAWSADEEPATSIRLPKIPFDALRVETVSYQGTGPALCEIELFHGRTNLARGKTVTASGTHNLSPQPAAVVDGIKDSSALDSGYWAGPDRELSWIEVQVAPPALREMTVYLSDLPAIDARMIGGSTLFDRQLLGGVKSSHSLFTHPDHNSSSHVAFVLDKKYHTLSGAAGILDRVQRSATPLTFRIVGDGNELWRETIQEAGARHPLNISVDRVARLDLFVDCPGSADQGHAMWVDLELTTAGKAAATKATKAR